ncbi:MAG: hypothetical protein LBJ00_08120 [Planctomycetaceae bacterium]|nr:hypothetical protein [Planctomycetaceae bacterium]
MCEKVKIKNNKYYTQTVLKFPKLDTQSQQREAVVQGRSPSPYRLRYAHTIKCNCLLNNIKYKK